MAASPTRPQRPTLAIEAIATFTGDDAKTSIVLEVMKQTKPGQQLMKAYKTNVLFSLIMGLEEAYADVNLELQAELFTCDYVKAANGYVLTMPAMLLPVFQVYYDYEAKADDGNTLFLRAKPYVASDKAKGTSDGIEFGFAQGPKGACITDSALSETVRSALGSVGMEVHKFHPVKDGAGIPTGKYAFHFHTKQPIAGNEQYDAIAALKKTPPRTSADGYPIDLTFSNKYCDYIGICVRCLQTRDPHGGFGKCMCNITGHKWGGNPGADKKRGRATEFQRLKARQRAL